MTICRRPIFRSTYRWSPEPKQSSLRYELICGGTVRRYPDGREVCQDSLAGWKEYKRRIEIMWRDGRISSAAYAGSDSHSGMQPLNTRDAEVWDRHSVRTR